MLIGGSCRPYEGAVVPDEGACRDTGRRFDTDTGARLMGTEI